MTGVNRQEPDGGSSPDGAEDPHRLRLERLLARLPQRLRAAGLWLLRPESRWARLPAGVLLILGGFLSILPVFGLWMLPLGVVLIAEDIPVLRRTVARALHRAERRWPRLFNAPGGD